MTLLPIAQIVLSLFAGWGLFLLWRQMAASSRTVAWLVTAGVLIRAVVGVLAFWISYLHVPIARSLQLGNGFWVFAIDAQTYYQQAASAALAGPTAILGLDKGVASPFFIQTLAFALLLTGTSVATALLLNTAAYLGCCRIVLSFGDPKKHRAVVFGIAVLSFAPSLIMWSMQPYKDICFLFLVATFFGAARAWERLREAPTRARQLTAAVLWSAVMWSAVYGISGIRWYFGLVIAIAAVPFVLLMHAPRRLIAVISGVLLLPLLLVAVVLAAGPYAKPFQDAVINQYGAHPLSIPGALAGLLGRSREGFDRVGGATMIGAGNSIRRIDESLGNREIRVLTDRPDERTSSTLPPATTPVATPVQSTPVAQSPATPTVGVTPAPPVPVTQSEGGGAPSPTIAMPSSPVTRLVAGVAAMVLPRSVAQWIGILEVGRGRGGRGLWLFVEIDTIVFDIVLIFTIVSLVTAVRQRRLGAPLFWLMLIVTGTIGAVLCYTVSNFGTLFRHRDMILLGLTLLPLTTLSAKSEVAMPVCEDALDVVGDVPNAVQSVS